MISFEDVQLLCQMKLGHEITEFPRFIRVNEKVILVRSDTILGYRQLLVGDRGEGEGVSLICDCATFALPGYGTCVHCEMVRKKYKLG